MTTEGDLDSLACIDGDARCVLSWLCWCTVAVSVTGEWVRGEPRGWYVALDLRRADGEIDGSMVESLCDKVDA